MPLHIERNDITRMQVDAIVTAANEKLQGGGGVDGMVHRAAGPKLLQACLRLRGCKTGSAVITRAYGLPSKWVIHAVGPVWRGGTEGEEALLSSCCKKALELALEKKCASVALPLISSGAYGYPKREAFSVLTRTAEAFLMAHDEMDVYIVLFDREAMLIGEELYHDIIRYIDQNYVAAHTEPESERMRRMQAAGCAGPAAAARPMPEEQPDEAAFPMPEMYSAGVYEDACAPDMGFAPASLWDGPMPDKDELLGMVDESFVQMLLRKIDEKGWKDSDCYKRANIDRKHFSKMRSDIHYRPKKSTAVALAVALELTLDETRELLMKAGFALSHSSISDIVVEYFIRAGNYDIHALNCALFAFDQETLG